MRYAHMDVGNKLSASKARRMLHDKTEKQRRYVASHGYGNETDVKTFCRHVIALLNRRTRHDTQLALRALEKAYLSADEPRVGLEFSSCSEKPVSKVYAPFRTGYANAHRIHMCSDTLSDAFNATHSKQITYDQQYVSHYAVVFLHEFGHVLDKRHIKNVYYGEGNQEDPERRADAYAQHMIEGAQYGG